MDIRLRYRNYIGNLSSIHLRESSPHIVIDKLKTYPWKVNKFSLNCTIQVATHLESIVWEQHFFFRNQRDMDGTAKEISGECPLKVGTEIYESIV